MQNTQYTYLVETELRNLVVCSVALYVKFQNNLVICTAALHTPPPTWNWGSRGCQKKYRDNLILVALADLEVDGTSTIVHCPQQRGGETEVHRERGHVRLGVAQLAQGAHRQRLERHVACAGRKVQNPLWQWLMVCDGGTGKDGSIGRLTG